MRSQKWYPRVSQFFYKTPFKWDRIHRFFQRNEVNIALVFPLFVPLVVRILALIKSNENVLLNLFGLNTVVLPDLSHNVIRVYWVAVFYGIVLVFYKVFCPSVISYFKDFEEWTKSDEAKKSLKKSHEDYGTQPEKENIHISNLHHDYNSLLEKAKFEKTLARWIMTILSIPAIYFLYFIVLDQVRPVFSQTTCEVIIPWSKDVCVFFAQFKW